MLFLGPVLQLSYFNIPLLPKLLFGRAPQAPGLYIVGSTHRRALHSDQRQETYETFLNSGPRVPQKRDKD